jgi:hypothetical protein
MLFFFYHTVVRKTNILSHHIYVQLNRYGKGKNKMFDITNSTLLFNSGLGVGVKAIKNKKYRMEIFVIELKCMH